MMFLCISASLSDEVCALARHWTEHRLMTLILLHLILLIITQSFQAIKQVYNEQQLKYINAIKKSSENLSLVINDILDFSKIEAGKIELENVPFRPKDVIADVYNIFLG